MEKLHKQDCFIIQPAVASTLFHHNLTTIPSSDVTCMNMIAANQNSLNDPSVPSDEPLCNDPAKAAILKTLCETTGYTLKQENGQRKYGGPPPGWGNSQIPGKGCEVFVGKLPRDLYEDELVPVLEKCGRLFELRLMMDFNGNNRGFAFVKYCTGEGARRALKELNNFEIRKGRLLGVCKSVDNCRLFVGGIPKSKQKDEIRMEMQKITEGVTNVIVYPSAADKSKNRGFAFVEYQDHHTAAMARRKLMHTRPQVWGHPIAVDWAEPEVEVDDDVMATVKILYVRNLMLNTTEEQLEQEFLAVVPPEAIERVKKIRDYGFVHFNTRENAIKCMNMLSGKLLDGAPMEVTLAKPVDRETYVRYTRAANRVPVEAQPEALASAYPGYVAFDPRIDAAAAAAAAASNYSFAAPIYYGGVPYSAASFPAIPQPRYAIQPGFGDLTQIQNLGMPTIGAAGVPLGIPGSGIAGSHGRGVAYRGGRNRATGTRVGARNYISVAGRGYPTTYYSHYRRQPLPHQQQVLSVLQSGPGEKFDLRPDMELTPISQSSLKPNSLPKSSVQLLEEYCTKTQSVKPEYKLHTAPGPSGRQLFLYRVELPDTSNNQQQLPPAQGQQSPQESAFPRPLSNKQQQHSSNNNKLFTPTKLSTSLEQAKEIAAAHVLAEVTTNAMADVKVSDSNVYGNQNDATNQSSGLNGYYGSTVGDVSTANYPYPVYNNVNFSGLVTASSDVYNQQY